MRHFFRNMKLITLLACLITIFLTNSQANVIKRNYSQEFLKYIVTKWRNDYSGHECGPGEAVPKSRADLPCDTLLSVQTVQDIRSYQNAVDQIIDLFTNGSYKGKVFDFLAELTDTFGHRLTGSKALDDAIDWMLNRGTFYGYNGHTEPVTAPHWVRNNESLYMMSPRVQNFPLLGLGKSIGTPPEGIVADVLVVTSFDDLASKSGLVPGRIVVYNVPFTSYGETVQYRSHGADEASKYGAVASLLRSVTSFSIVSPHTGIQSISGDYPAIPAAAITVEDAEMLSRMQARGQIVSLHLTMGAQNFENALTRNTILDIPGSISPEEVVVVSGHLDSWDAGVGAMDDAGGCVIGFLAGSAINELGLPLRRTFRTILFTAEEQGIYGGEAYFTAHATEAANFQIMMESDMGIFNPLGIQFSGTDEATCMMQEILNLTSSLNTNLVVSPAETPDLGLWMSLNVPRGSLYNENDRYFWYHHSNGDRMEVFDSDSLDKVGALWTSVSYVLADMIARLPH